MGTGPAGSGRVLDESFFKPSGQSGAGPFRRREFRLHGILPGGKFLMSGLTCRRFRQMPCTSPVWPAMALDQRHATGSVSADATLRKHVLQVIDGLEPMQDHDELIDRGSRFIDTIGQ
jgi:hypothetical protein